MTPTDNPNTSRRAARALCSLAFAVILFPGYCPKAQGGCSTYFHFAHTQRKKAEASDLRFEQLPHAFAKAAEHFHRIRDLEKAGRSEAGVYEVLQKPIPLDYQFEIYAQSYPRGKAGGALWHIRPRPEARELVRRDGPNYVKLKTENNPSTQGLFSFLHRRLETDQELGEYWTTRESPELFENLRKEWNKKFEKDRYNDEYRIELQLATTGADPQLRMAKLRAKGVVGVASPEVAEPYIATAGGVPSLENLGFEMDGATGRVIQNSSLAVHDWREIDSALWISSDVVHTMRQNSELWVKIHAQLARNKTLPLTKDGKSRQTSELLAKIRSWLARNKTLPLARDRRSRELSDLFRQFAATAGPDNPYAERAARGFEEGGAQWWRLAEVEIYQAQRTFHSFNHVLSLLLQHPQGIKPGDSFPEFGPIHQSELNMHLRGLGLQAGAPRDNPSPLVQLTYNSATSQEPLTLARALERVINGERKRLEEFAKIVPDPEVKRLITEYLREQEPMREGDFQRMARLLQARYRRMGTMN